MKGTEDSQPSNVLLLGMVFAHQATEPKRGQEYRDRVRCESVQELGFQVYTLDDKHSDTSIDEHCQANFSDTRRMMQSIQAKWPDSLQFQEIILDYFFSPVGWARCRWGDKFFTQTLPAFAERGLLKENGKIWLPNLPCIEEQLSESMAILDQYYLIELPTTYLDNPLYRGTEGVESDLLKCPDALTNETQLRPLLEHSTTPFYRLSLKRDWKIPRSPLKTLGKSRKISEIIDGDDSNTSTPKKRRTRQIK